MAASSDEPGIDALRRLKSADLPQWLAPSADLSSAARAASRHLFSSLKTYAQKSPFEKLLTDGFDSEQIWLQIDLQTQPLIASLRREVKRLEKDPNELLKLRVSEREEEGGEKIEKFDMEDEDFGDEFDEELEDDDEEEENEDKEIEEDDDGDEDEDDDGDDDDDEDGENGEDYSDVEIEDQFLKIKDLEEFMEDDEAREYGLDRKEKNKKNKKEKKNVKEKKDSDDEDDDEEEDEDEFRGFGLEGNEDEEDDNLGNARYDDFFGGKKNKPSKKKSKVTGDSDDSVTDDEKQKVLSTHEKERKKIQSRIEEMEKSNMDPKKWTMQGEVTALKRPKNSALEVDLDFEHNVRPPPVITEEITASLEDLIKSRVLEGQFDDVQKPLDVPSRAPRAVKELDENKSKKGLAEVYEEEYVQKTNVAFEPLSFADEEKKEASELFKKLCLKLDALSHFHFTPKPIIEDMSLPDNVPAFAMEEAQPLAVSDAAMLAPEELFSGKGDIKDETELTQAERKRRRATKKRKFKAETEKRIANKPRERKNNDDETAKEMTKKARVSTSQNEKRSNIRTIRSPFLSSKEIKN